MEQIERYLSNTVKKGATIGLLAAKGKEEFYSRYDYICRPNKSLGNGMCRFVYVRSNYKFRLVNYYKLF